MAKATLEERFWAKVDRRGPDDCWPWTGGKISSGYGVFWDGHVIPAHRFAYQHFVGPIPEGHDIDHTRHNADPTCPGGWTCPHRLCVNYLRHLEPATRSVNTGRGGSGRARGAQQRAKTHCPQGHPYDEANTRYVARRGRVERHCRACGRKRQREHQRRKRERPN